MTAPSIPATATSVPFTITGSCTVSPGLAVTSEISQLISPAGSVVVVVVVADVVVVVVVVVVVDFADVVVGAGVVVVFGAVVVVATVVVVIAGADVVVVSATISISPSRRLIFFVISFPFSSTTITLPQVTG